ncbi:serine protease [Ruegeria atlantica]|uniref:serine protease n=1 Tax=Ruegeria atlantica TaxID=81569 RepID=UPI00147C62E5|nr:serine protease [Ruegeria atlantica]
MTIYLRNSRLFPLCLALTFQAQIATAQQDRPIDRIKVQTAEMPTPKIVGGEPAEPGAFPFQVALIASHVAEGSEAFGQFCGGSLVAKDWVLTAAHCVPATAPEEVQIYAGSQTLPTGNGAAPAGVRVGLERIVSHQEYDAATKDNDIALLKLERPIEIQTTQPATVDNFSTALADGAEVTVIGWGHTSEGGQSTPVLQEVSVALQPRDTCEENYGQFLNTLPGGAPIITDNMFCAGRPQGGVDSCQGDSGGFIGIKSDNNGDGWIQFGIVSWGIGCARPELFGVYTNVANYIDWLTEVQSNF